MKFSEILKGYLNGNVNEDVFRSAFNSTFHVSVRGKMKGYKHVPDSVWYKLFKVLDGRYRMQYGSILVFSKNHIKYKFYSI